MPISLNRRTFVMSGLTAAASARAFGANDRLRIALVGPGTQGTGLLRELAKVSAESGAEVTAVCELWSKRREAAAAQVKQAGGREPRQLRRLEEVLQAKDVDGVIIATPDHQHARQLLAAVRAGKDVYLEKPMANTVAEAREVYRTVKGSKCVVQVGTQGLSSGHYQAVAALVRSGRLGKISRVTHEGFFNGPRWRPVAAVEEIREADTDWKTWLAGHRARPFDPHLYFEFRLYREFSHGIAAQWLTHAVAGVQHIMDDYFPESAVANGGVLIYRDGREASDTLSMVFTYPKGFLFTYAAMFGNDFPGFTRYFGQNGTVERVGEKNPYVARAAGGGNRPDKLTRDQTLDPVNPTSHLGNWLACMRSRRTPNADVLSGYGHTVAMVMASQAEVTGKRQYWDRHREEIVEHRPAGDPARPA
jgi:predicted dehydrogenase